jgi:hypothetical protein
LPETEYGCEELLLKAASSVDRLLWSFTNSLETLQNKETSSTNLFDDSWNGLSSSLEAALSSSSSSPSRFCTARQQEQEQHVVGSSLGLEASLRVFLLMRTNAKVSDKNGVVFLSMAACRDRVHCGSSSFLCGG